MIASTEAVTGGRPPFRLLTGCPRSGTSLLASELMRLYDVAVPFETHFIPVFERWKWLYGDLSIAPNRALLLADLYRFTRLWLAASKTFDLGQITRASVLITEPRAAEIVSRSHDYPSLLHALFADFAQSQGAAAYADKSTFFSPVAPAQLAAALGPVKVVIVVRDGRDVFQSAAKTWFGTSNAVHSARLWQKHIAAGEAWSEVAGASALTLRYEDLVHDPEGQLAAVARFLDLTPRAVPVSSFLAEAMASAPEHARLSGAVGPATVNRHQADMPRWQRDAFALFAGDALARYGYQTEPRPSHMTPRMTLSLISGFGPNPKRTAESLLPLIFACGGRLVLGRSGR